MNTTPNKILIIDDEEDICSLFKKILKDEDCTVLTVLNGYDGLQVLKKNVISLIILDLCMCGLSGMETLNLIRRKDKEVLVIVLTGFGDAETVRAAEGLNVYEYMSKPFKNEHIIKTVKEALASRVK